MRLYARPGYAKVLEGNRDRGAGVETEGDKGRGSGGDADRLSRSASAVLSGLTDHGPLNLSVSVSVCIYLYLSRQKETQAEAETARCGSTESGLVRGPQRAHGPQASHTQLALTPIGQKGRIFCVGDR
jgi:hypothetical protein